MKTIQLSTGARKPLKFFLLNLTLLSSVLLAHANSTNQIPARAEDAEPIAAMKNFGVAYRVDDATIANYKKFSVDLERSSGQTHHILPVPAVFIVNRTGEIVFVHADPDYKVRMKGAEVLAAAAKSAAASEAPQK
jgi:hypothetical protein